MATTINNSYSAIVPAVYGTATPVIDVGRGAGSVNAVVALTEAGSVVVNLGSPPDGAVTYSASGLVQEMTGGSLAPRAAADVPVKAVSKAYPVEPDVDAVNTVPMLGQSGPSGAGNPVTLGSGVQTDGIYDGSGVFTPTAGPSVEPVHTFGMAGTGAAMPATVGARVSTHA